ncbi:MAG: ATP synthase F1 subunit gamma [Candidatus Omnitrophica bacterium]|jgi:F-type H+-transporting ATPase subunit gamma|nr:ATP synthase F1 subunit gamma [Candidatus Omnitrophota bacterium]
MAIPLRQIKNRIKSVENTRKITQAMQMVSVSKLNRTQRFLEASRLYYQKLSFLLGRVVNLYKPGHPFLNPNKSQGLTLIVFTSDSGLCGLYNNNIIRCAQDFIHKNPRPEIKLIIVGKKGYNYFKKNKAVKIASAYLGLNGRYSDKLHDDLIKGALDSFLSGESGEVHICYTNFKNALHQNPMAERILSIRAPVSDEPKKINYITEPGIGEILDSLLKAYLSAQMRFILFSSFTCEHALRGVTMKMATDNARELLSNLVLLRNKLRQANITRDITEIISSAEALKR